jgi:hypothetical protein
MSYNKKTSAELGWKPEWFGCDSFGSELKSAIKSFQEEYDLDADGFCGPTTFRRKFNERAQEIERKDSDPVYSSHIICHGNPIGIEWNRVVLWTDKGGLKAKEGNYRKVDGKRNIPMFVTHWDVCLNSKTCQRVLDRRGISVHFLIDNDGTIYQTMDTTHIGWHAGSANNYSVGVEISNAYYLKYQNWYVKNGYGKRPIVEDAHVNGKKLKPHLGFYYIQEEALKALYKAINKGLGIPLETPLNFTGTQYTDTHSKVRRNQFKGFVHHYHITHKKIDCGGLDISRLLREIK